jgi:pilus assembly protein CpaF
VSFDLILPFMRPIEALLLDEEVSEIMGNPDSTWWVERDGQVRREPGVQFDASALHTGLEVIANHLGKKLDEDNPRLHDRLPDGSRIAVWISPLVSPAPAVSIRKFTARHFTVDDLIARGTVTQPLACLLTDLIRDGKTLLISGGTGSGKTTLLRILAEAVPDDERIVVIEDTPELGIRKPNIVPACSQANTFKVSVTFHELLKDSLRFRPDRIILGEVRGAEARTLLDSFNTGHGGSLATIHANSATKALRRFANLVVQSHPQTLLTDVEAEIAEAVDYVVHLDRQRGRRVVREVLRVEDYIRPAQRFETKLIYDAGKDAFENNGQYSFPFFDNWNPAVNATSISEAHYALV